MEIHSALVAKKSHRISESFFLDILARRFSRSEARRQLETSIDWGRSAELFGFEHDTDEQFLDTSEAADVPVMNISAPFVIQARLEPRGPSVA